MKSLQRLWSTLCPAFGLFGVVALLLLDSGCANLGAVRDFALEAGSLSAHRGVSDDLVATKRRLYAYASKEPGPDSLEKSQELSKKFDQTQQSLVQYMAALASLADNDLASFKKEIDAAGVAAGNAKLLPGTEAGLFAAAGNLVAQALTDRARQRLLREVIRKTDPAIQQTTAGLAALVRKQYFSSLDIEQQGAEEFVTEIKLEKIAGLSRLTDFLMRDELQRVARQKESGEAYAKALDKIGEAHARLAREIGDFTAKEFVAQLKDYGDELKALHNQLKN